MGQARRRKKPDGTYREIKGSNFKFDQFEQRVRASGKLMMKYDLVKNKQQKVVQ